MRFNFLGAGADRPEENKPVTRIDVWFDWSGFKVWYVTCYDADGNTVGESEDFAHKRSAVRHAKELQKAPGPVPVLNIGTREGGMV
ncbi:hypothetical protein MAL1_00234 [Bacteriophage DSS3_MAL1]|nr:hypothetical protein MAL1_00234 [Bacteriophage DSS3_MAL1]